MMLLSEETSVEWTRSWRRHLQLLSAPFGILANSLSSEHVTEEKMHYSLNMVVKTMSHVRTSSTASITWSFLNFLFSVPPWSFRTRSRAAMRSSFVSIFAFTGESGSHARTAKPTRMARPPSRMKITRKGARCFPFSNDIPWGDISVNCCFLWKN